jgi:hypothetical protein
MQTVQERRYCEEKAVVSGLWPIALGSRCRTGCDHASGSRASHRSYWTSGLGEHRSHMLLHRQSFTFAIWSAFPYKKVMSRRLLRVESEEADWLTNLRQLKKSWVYAAFGRSMLFASPTMVRREARTGSGSGAGSSQKGAKACQPR